MPTPDAWTDRVQANERRANWHYCDCEVCPCEETVRGSDKCHACTAGQHQTDPA